MTRDVKYAIRRLLHNPGFSLVVVMTLALGIGANTAIFSIVNGVLLRPLPYDQPDRLVTLNHFYPNLDGLEAGFAVPTYRDIRERMKIFDAFAVAQGWNANLTGIGQPERLIASKATAEFFKVYGVQPRLGRTFAAGEDHAGTRQGRRPQPRLLAAPLRRRRLGRRAQDPARRRALRRHRRDAGRLLQLLQPHHRPVGAGGVHAGTVRRQPADQRVSRRRRAPQARHRHRAGQARRHRICRRAQARLSRFVRAANGPSSPTP